MQSSRHTFSARRGAAMASGRPPAGFALALAAMLLGACAGAAELGDVKVSSYVGQPLVADIELVSLTPAEMEQLQVHHASADVYRVASIGMDPALKTLALSVMRRDQRAFLHVTSLKQVDASHLNLFLELRSGDNSAVRAVTVWLEPEPKPVKAAMAAAAAAPMPAVATPAPAPAPATATASAHVELPAPAPAPAASRPTPTPPTPSNQPTQPTQPTQPAPLVPPAPAAAPAAPAAKIAAIPAPHAESSVSKPDAAAAKPIFERPAQDSPARLKPLAGAAPAGSCAPRSGDASACAALDRKNTLIAHKLVVLEGKVKQLQDELSLSPSGVSATVPALVAAEAPRLAPAQQDARAEASHPEASHADASHADAAHAADGASAAAKADAAKPAAAPAPKPVQKHAPVPLKPKAKTPESAQPATSSSGMKPTTLLALGTGALLLLIGAGVHFWRRRKKSKRSGEPSAPSKYWVLLRHPFRKKKKAYTAPEAVTSVATDVATEVQE